MRAFIGYGKSSLDAIVRHFAAEQGLTVKGDQSPDRGSFYRSDQFSFAKISVPAFYPSNGTEFIGRPEGWGKGRLKSGFRSTISSRATSSRTNGTSTG